MIDLTGSLIHLEVIYYSDFQQVYNFQMLVMSTF